MKTLSKTFNIKLKLKRVHDAPFLIAVVRIKNLLMVSHF